MYTKEQLTKAHAAQLDQNDPLGKFRNRFHFPNTDKRDQIIYLCGNSLGLQPDNAAAAVEQEMEDWRNLGVSGHFHSKNPWKQYHTFLTDSMAKLVGAKPIEVVVMGTLTSNLNSALISFYRSSGKRNKILIEAKAFPSDIYSVESHVKFHGLDPDESFFRMEPREGENCLRTDDILEVIEEMGDTLATVMLGGVNYYTGEFFDLEEITKAAHSVGATAGYDLAHAAGNINLKLHEWNVDFAVWCTYKYINGGPGSTGGLFIHERHANDFSIPRLAGWWGHDTSKRFLMESQFEPMPGAEGWQNSNPSILPMACLKASLELFDEAGIENLREKSVKLTSFLEALVLSLGDEVIEVITPKDTERRGAQLSIRVKNADKTLHEKITEKGVICDWREPDVIRVAPVPFYNSFTDVYDFYCILKDSI